jgi:hypothetical protein
MLLDLAQNLLKTLRVLHLPRLHARQDAVYAAGVVHLHYLFFLAVFAAALNAALVGAPFDPAFLIFSPEPALMRLRFA